MKGINSRTIPAGGAQLVHASATGLAAEATRWEGLYRKAQERADRAESRAISQIAQTAAIKIARREQRRAKNAAKKAKGKP